MKTFILILTFIILSINIFAQSYDIYKGDTINRVDVSGLKQGLWIFFDGTEKTKISQKGKYVNSKKEGIWQMYYPNGNLKSEITYLNNKQDGYAKIYYETGKLSEEGLWKGNRWVGQYKFYHENGNPAYVWNFNEEGKRTGEQRYFYENGQVRIEGNWNEGKEQGVIKEYYENGKLRAEGEWKDGKADGTTKEYYETGALKAEKKFNNGVFDENSSKIYARNNTNNNIKPDENKIKTDTVKIVVDNANKDPNVDAFTGNGYHKIFNSAKQIEREGMFQNGKLMDGKRYYYENGKLTKTAIYEDGNVKEIVKANP